MAVIIAFKTSICYDFSSFWPNLLTITVAVTRLRLLCILFMPEYFTLLYLHWFWCLCNGRTCHYAYILYTSLYAILCEYVMLVWCPLMLFKIGHKSIAFPDNTLVLGKYYWCGSCDDAMHYKDQWQGGWPVCLVPLLWRCVLTPHCTRIRDSSWLLFMTSGTKQPHLKIKDQISWILFLILRTMTLGRRRIGHLFLHLPWAKVALRVPNPKQALKGPKRK